MKPFIRAFDKTVNSWVRRLPGSLDGFFLAITNLGDPVVVITIAAFWGGVALWQHNLDLVLAVSLVPLTLLVGFGIKLLFERARPVGDFSHLLKLDTFSFPSGHSSGSAASYGLSAYLVWQTLPDAYAYPVGALLVTIPLLVGVSRVYLSVHYPSDVVAGWSLGALMVAVAVFVIQPLA